MSELLDFAVAGGAARLRFNNPRRLNAINAQMWRELADLLARVAADTAIRVLVISGNGERAFCTGNDISEFDSMRADPEAAGRYNALQRAVAVALQSLTKPVIAAVHGYCLGAGLEIALMADLRICTVDARMGVPAVKLGLPYRIEDIAKVADIVGLPRAREMVLLGRQYSGYDILALGLAHRIAADRAAMTEDVEAMVQEILANAPLSLAAAKVAFAELSRRDAPPDLEKAGQWADRCYASADYAEGRAARREKRAPRFTGQ